ncbi:hypothetical protein JRI60_47560 [Archangium violaceum]|uniref:hypothetical protein n=1 Tax=Archangium violaceum TaxID=83451 RepID=UPI0019524D30|nr:hypothetical protein [Archangium violaceum]QRN96578.1 hypothetical protein JRI60_47560 [Archangium violaceum]
MRTPVLIATLALGCAAASPAEAHKPSTPEASAPAARPATPAPKADRKAEPWNGGKARPPFTLRATPHGTVKAQTPLTLVATIVPEQTCTSLSTRVRGAEGVVVQGTEKQHPTCEPGQPAIHEVTVTVPPGVSGHAVVDVRMEVQGRVYESSQSIPLSAEGASQSSKPQPGTVERDESGGKVIILRPSKKEQ